MKWGIEELSFPETDFFDEDIQDSGSTLKNENYEAGASIKYLSFEGYRIPLSNIELDKLKARADEYLKENGVMIGFINNLLA